MNILLLLMSFFSYLFRVKFQFFKIKKKYSTKIFKFNYAINFFKSFNKGIANFSTIARAHPILYKRFSWPSPDGLFLPSQKISFFFLFLTKDFWIKRTNTVFVEGAYQDVTGKITFKNLNQDILTIKRYNTKFSPDAVRETLVNSKPNFFMDASHYSPNVAEDGIVIWKLPLRQSLKKTEPRLQNINFFSSSESSVSINRWSNSVKDLANGKTLFTDSPSSLFLQNPALRRFINPSAIKDFNPSERFLFPSQTRYTKFVHSVPIKNSRTPFSYKGPVSDQVYPQNPSQLYYYSKNPSTSFNAEYDLSTLRDVFSKGYRTDQSVKRHFPFKKRYFDYFDRDPAPDHIFKLTNYSGPTHHRMGFEDILKRKQNVPVPGYQKNFKDVNFINPVYSDTNFFVFWVNDISKRLYGYIHSSFIQPVTTLINDAILKDTFLGDTLVSFFFYFQDYVFLIFQLYFPAFWIFFDYNFSTYKLVSFGQFFSMFLLFFSIFCINYFVFKPIAERVFFYEFPPLLATTSFFIYAFFTNFSFFISLFFLIGFLLFPFSLLTPYTYYRVFPFFLPKPLVSQVFGFYKKDYFFSRWPIRFTFFNISLRSLYYFPYSKSKIRKEQIRVTLSFFFFKNFSYFKKPSVYIPISYLQTGTPFFGPNVFPLYNYNSDQVDTNLLHLNEQLTEDPSLGYLESEIRPLEYEAQSNKYKYIPITESEGKLTPVENLIYFDYAMKLDRSDSEDSELAVTGLWLPFSVSSSAKPVLPYYAFTDVTIPYKKLFYDNTLFAFLYALSPKEFIKFYVKDKSKTISEQLSRKPLVYIFFDIFFFFISIFLSFLSFPFNFFYNKFHFARFRLILFFIYCFFFTLFFSKKLVIINKNWTLFYKNYRKILRADLSSKSTPFYSFFFHFFFFCIFKIVTFIFSENIFVTYIIPRNGRAGIPTRISIFSFAFCIYKISLCVIHEKTQFCLLLITLYEHIKLPLQLVICGILEFTLFFFLLFKF